MPNPENVIGKGFDKHPEHINRKGNPGSKWLSTLLKEKLAEGDRGAKILERLIELADKGDLAAIKEILDRVDGKANQEIKVEGSLEPPKFIIKRSSTPLANNDTE